MTLTVSVTQDHIDQGKPGKCRECPIARALLDLFVQGTYVGVAWKDAAIRCSNQPELDRITPVELPLEVIDFIKDFDDDPSWAAPFTFSVDLPEHLVPYLKNPIPGLEKTP